MGLGSFERSTKLEGEQKDCFHDVEEKTKPYSRAVSSRPRYIVYMS